MFTIAGLILNTYRKENATIQLFHEIKYCFVEEGESIIVLKENNKEIIGVGIKFHKNFITLS